MRVVEVRTGILGPELYEGGRLTYVRANEFVFDVITLDIGTWWRLAPKEYKPDRKDRNQQRWNKNTWAMESMPCTMACPLS